MQQHRADGSSAHPDAEPSSAPPARDRAGPVAATIPIVLEPIRVPAQVDQPQWLVRLPDDSLAVLEQERWASPLRDELREALLEQLAAGYGAVEARSAVAGSGAPVRIVARRASLRFTPGRRGAQRRFVDARAAARAHR